MAKAIEGAALLAGAVGMGVAAFYDPALLASPLFDKVWASMITAGVSMEAGAIANALTSNRGMAITSRQAAAARQIIYGQQRVGGVEIFRSTTGGSKGQFNYVIVLAGHVCDSIVNLYLDGRQVHFVQGSVGNVTRNGVNFGGSADSNSYPGPNGIQYNFGGKVYCEARFGDQLPGDVIGGLTANDPVWAATAQGSPYVGGCCYVYLKVEYDTNVFPGEPEMKFTVNGKHVYDPRTGTPAFSSNWALVAGDVLVDPVFGLGDNATPQFINATFEYGDLGWSSRPDGWGIGSNPTFYSPDGQGGTWCGYYNATADAPTGAMRNDARVSATAGEFFSLQGWVYRNGAVNSGSDGVARIEFYDVNGAECGFVDGSSSATAGWFLSTASGVAPSGTVTASVACVVYYCTDGSYLFNDFQFNAPYNSINQAQWIAAANVCDERVPLGGTQTTLTESRYNTNHHYDTSVSPGDALSGMMAGAAGRLSNVGGQWFLYPAYFIGPTLSFDENSIIGNFSWDSNRTVAELFNRVTGTFTAPNYPYNTGSLSNEYDTNGYYAGQIQNNWAFGFTETSFPQYAEDVAHGFAADQYLVRDLGVQRPKEIALPTVLSIVQAQRVAKITLERNAQQGSGSFQMALGAWRLQPCDVFYMTWPLLGWTEKLLEVVGVTLTFEPADNGVLVPMVQVSVQETAASVYSWNAIEQMTIMDQPASPTQIPQDPAPPTSMELTSGAATALVTLDGVVHSRIEVIWNEPLDISTKQIQVQFAAVSNPTLWIDAGLVDVQNTLTYISNVVAGQAYNVRIRSLRANGAASPWEEIDGYTVSVTLSVLGILSLAPGTLIGEAFSDGTAAIIVEPVNVVVGNATASLLPAGPVTLSGLNQSQLYYVYYVDMNFTGGAITPIATQSTADFINKPGYFLIDEIVTPSLSTGSGGGTSKYIPSTYSDVGSRTTTSPAAAYDGNVNSDAQVSASSTNYPASHPPVFTTASGHCIWQGFPSVSPATSTTLNVVASCGLNGSGTATFKINGNGTALLNATTAQAETTYTLNIPAGTNLSSITVEAIVTANATGGTSSGAYINGFEIWIQ